MKGCSMKGSDVERGRRSSFALHGRGFGLYRSGAVWATQDQHTCTAAVLVLALRVPVQLCATSMRVIAHPEVSTCALPVASRAIHTQLFRLPVVRLKLGQRLQRESLIAYVSESGPMELDLVKKE
jgi:hypothetical protein